MKIAHTSDLHIDSQHQERWDALQIVLEKAGQEKVDYLVIAGDLFDDVEAASEYITKLRRYFSGLGFKVIMIAGNHDYKSFEDERDLGDDVIVLSRKNPLFKDASNGVSFFTVPYLQGVGNEYFYEQLAYISKNLESTVFNILVYHGDLDEVVKKVRYRREVTGGEVESAFSLSVRVLQKFPMVQLVLSGHYHTYGDPIPIDETGRFVVYSGAPVSITRGDLGPRYLVVYDVNRESKSVSVSKLPLGTLYFEKLEIHLSPTSVESIENVVFSGIQNSLKGDSGKILLLQLKGYINSQEQGINEVKLKDIVRRYCEEKWKGRVVLQEDWFGVLDVAFLVDKPFSRSILEQIERLDLQEEDKRILKEWFVSALSKVYSQKVKI
ncbi:MAG: metallophosphoesterase [bacterium]|nr:metallophosphoesterase [bacterium]